MSTLRQQMIQDLQLAGLASSTQVYYVRSVRQLAEHFGTSPDQLTEKQVREYFLFLKNSRKYSPNTVRGIYAAIKFFYSRTVPRKWRTLAQLKVPRQKTLPDVLTRQQARRLIEAAHTPYVRTYFWTVYSCGLRLSESLKLRVGDIDGERMLLHVRHGKGGKDRYVPLPTTTLTILREYWAYHRNPVWLFPAKPQRPETAHAATGPMGKALVQGAIRALVQELEIHKRVSIHTLRHSYATHLLEAGVSLRLIQKYLGHRHMQTTMLYLHLTTTGEEQAQTAIDKLME